MLRFSKHFFFDFEAKFVSHEDGRKDLFIRQRPRGFSAFSPDSTAFLSFKTLKGFLIGVIVEEIRRGCS